MRTLLNKITFGKLGSIKGTNTAIENPNYFEDNLLDLKQKLRLKHGQKAHAAGKTAQVAPVHHRAVLKDVTEAKGVTAEVISDDQLPPVETTPAAEVIILPREQTVAPNEEEPADLRFWWAFIQRIESRDETLTFDSAEAILAAKPDLSKGYHTVRLHEAHGPCSPLGYKHNGTGLGIVHVTKSNINALVLVDAHKGIFRTVSANTRFHGADEVGIVEAKAFLNGR